MDYACESIISCCEMGDSLRRYCEPMTQPGRRRRPARDAVPGGWQARLTRIIAGEVRRYRLLREMSAQDLADRCEELGLSIPRPVLSNLENGRRDSITVAELLVLAAALEISPMMLAIPLGRQEEMEVLPGRSASPWDAGEWWRGSPDLVLPDGRVLIEGKGVGVDPVGLKRLHDDTLREIQAAHVQKVDERLRRAEWQLAFTRKMMRDYGLIPPLLDPEIEYLDKVEPEPWTQSSPGERPV